MTQTQSKSSMMKCIRGELGRRLPDDPEERRQALRDAIDECTGYSDGPKTRYDLPPKLTSMLYTPARQSRFDDPDTKREGIAIIDSEAAWQEYLEREGLVQAPDMKPDRTPQLIDDVIQTNVHTQQVQVECDELRKLPKITSPDIAADILDDMSNNDREEVRVLYLDNSNRVIGIESAHKGSINASVCEPHEVFKTALLLNANAVIVAHNHPAGDPHPSDADITSAKRFKDAGKLLGITLHDSMIIGRGSYYSLQQEGHLRDW